MIVHKKDKENKVIIIYFNTQNLLLYEIGQINVWEKKKYWNNKVVITERRNYPSSWRNKEMRESRILGGGPPRHRSVSSLPRSSFHLAVRINWNWFFENRMSQGTAINSYKSKRNIPVLGRPTSKKQEKVSYPLFLSHILSHMSLLITENWNST